MVKRKQEPTKKATKETETIQAVKGIKKKRRFRPGTVSLRQIRKYQRSCDLLISKLPFKRLVKEIAHQYDPELRFKKTAIQAIQEATEAYIVELFRDANVIAIHSKRETLNAEDMKVARRVKGEIQ